jgi:hypothetical protein
VRVFDAGDNPSLRPVDEGLKFSFDDGVVKDTKHAR